MRILRRAGISVWCLLFDLPSWACPFCNPQTRQALYNSEFLPNLATMLLAFLAIGLLVGLLAVLAARTHKKRIALPGGAKVLNPVPLAIAATVLGIGIVGFIDGIALHQILQWHEMLSNKISPTTYVGKTVNMFWDGIFHAFSLVVTLIGIGLLWRLLRLPNLNRSGYLFSGGLLAGWGLFNLVEGVIDHQWLKLHNVREVADDLEAWNLGFLGLSLLLLSAGIALQKAASGQTKRGSLPVR